MGNITANLSNGVPPYSFVVRKIGESTGNRCLGLCNGFPIEFTHDTGKGDYYFIGVDSRGCTVDSRVITGGIGSVNCDVEAPVYIIENTNIRCEGETLIAGSVKLSNVFNATRYVLCYNNTFNCNCTTDSVAITGGEAIIPIRTSAPNTPTVYTIRVFNGEDCETYTDVYGSMANPVCAVLNAPDFGAAVLQPACSTQTGGVIQNATLKLTNITNATRYKLCYNSNTFNSGCQAGCTSSDGIINSSAKDITITAPSEGVSQDITIRLFNGDTCNYFKDYTFSIYSQKCSSSEVSVMTMDLQVFENALVAKCDKPATYSVEYDFYLVNTTQGMNNTQRVRTGATAERTYPNGNDVPNVFVAAGFKPICAGGVAENSTVSNIFYRFTWNTSLMKAKYPNINEFTFDVFANKTKDTGDQIYSNSIRPYINAFTGTAMVKMLYSNNSNDAYREPREDGFSCSNQSCPDPFDLFTNTSATMPDVIYKTTVTGSRKIASIKYNYTTNKVTWTEFPQ